MRFPLVTMARRRAVNRIARPVAALCCFGVLLAPATVTATTAAAVEARAPTHWAALPGPTPVARAAALTRATWLTGVSITEYYPVPESWFRGRRVSATGLTGSHRVDWLYSARGVTMQGTGIGLDGRFYHVAGLGRGGWVDRLGRPAAIGSAREVFWRAGGFWRTALGAVTFPLENGGWANGTGVGYVALPGVSFAPGHGQPGLRYYHSLAVDPALIPRGSRVYIPAYHGKGGGWFLAQDTGGAIRGRHVDVYRSPPISPSDIGQSLTAQRILVVPPGQRAPVPAQLGPTAQSTPSGGPATGGSAPGG